jgi:hypothetical protein
VDVVRILAECVHIDADVVRILAECVHIDADVVDVDADDVDIDAHDVRSVADDVRVVYTRLRKDLACLRGPLGSVVLVFGLLRLHLERWDGCLARDHLDGLCVAVQVSDGVLADRELPLNLALVVAA